MRRCTLQWLREPKHPRMKRVVLFIFFNRPGKALATLDAILASGCDHLILSSDGPRPGRLHEAELVQSLRAKIEARCSGVIPYTKLYSPQNRGCAEWVSASISYALNQYGECIILEDDCVPSSSFIPFCAEMLERYRGNPRVMSISGTNLMGKTGSGRGYGFCSFPQIWGWATWRRAWSEYRLQIPYIEADFEFLMNQKKTDREGLRQWGKMLKQIKTNPQLTWDYQFVLKTLYERGLCIFPRKNLITNIGYDKDATHTTGIIGKFAALHRYSDLQWNNQEDELLDERYDSFIQTEYFHDRNTWRNIYFKLIYKFKHISCNLASRGE